MSEPFELAIRTQGLIQRFGQFEALRGVDLEVPLGSVFGLVGPNGAGKTTTFSILCGFLSPTEGQAFVLGHPAHDRVRLAGRVGALPQDAPLPSRMTTLEALIYFAELQGLGGHEAKSAAQEALESVGLSREASKKCGALSHGMAKRISLAQAFLGAPDVVLLDGPTAGLDPKAAHEIKDLIRQRTGQATIVVSSHDLGQIEELCDAVAILDRGRIAQQGSLGEVTGRGELLRLELADDDATKALEALAKLSFAHEPTFDPAARQLSVRIKDAPADEAIPAVLTTVLGAGGRIVGLNRGQRLEERVLELT